MRTHNMLAEYYKVLSDIEIEQRGLADSCGLFIPTVKVAFRRDINFEMGCYNLPTVAGVAMIFHY